MKIEIFTNFLLLTFFLKDPVVFVGEQKLSKGDDGGQLVYGPATEPEYCWAHHQLGRQGSHTQTPKHHRKPAAAIYSTISGAVAVLRGQN